MKVQSKISYELGTIILDDDTGETYIVTKVVRIGITDEYNYGVTADKIEVYNVHN
jgi:hypothetical protein